MNDRTHIGVASAAPPSRLSIAPVATPIVITVRDASGNKVSGEAGNLAASVTAGPNTGATVAAITEAGDTTYTTSYAPTIVGTDQVAITLGGTPISGSPYSSTRSKATTSPRRTCQCGSE